MSDFVHLHVHTEYSLLDGLSHIQPLMQKVKESGQDAIAITDHGAMYGVIPFYNAAKKAGIKPIIGMEAYMAEESRHNKQKRMGADQYHLTLIAKNNAGYINLMQLTSRAYLEGFSYKPRIDLELLKEHREGIIVLSGCMQSLINQKIMQNKPKEARQWVETFTNTFEGDFYIEIQDHPKLQHNESIKQQLIDLAHEYGLPLVATNDVHYINPDDAEAQDALLAVQMRKTIEDEDRLSLLHSPDFYLKTADEMKQSFAKHEEALANTVKIAEECNVTINTGEMIFPNYPLKKDQTPETALREMAHERLKDRYDTITDEITKRLEYELDIICSKGYASYFLIVQDFVNWAKDQDIGVGPGRGSAAGSLVSYSLRITDIDPIKHDLPFERFMNPQRPSPPDIDIDIADVKRDEVIRYTADQYGSDHVAQVITFGTMEARAAVRDIGRVLGMPYSEPDLIAKLIPQGMSLKEAISSVPELKDHYKEPKYKKLLDLAQKVEGSARHHSVHAAAVVIADKPLTQYTPIQQESKGGKTITQYDMYALDLNISDDAIGLLKMDFLGLRNLSILGEAIQLVKKHQDKKIDISTIPIDDKKVYDLLSDGETTGVFQLESAGMRRVARSLQPSRFSDITAMVALYRPGPMELIDDFIEGKKNPKSIKYPHPDLKPVLEETYGIPVYQEQVLQIANVFAGYSLGEADILRRAIGKKKKSILDKEKKRFIQGADKKGYSKKKAEEIWGFIEKFAGYGFNKAHSASYGMIAYQTAYMKANFPVEYMTALLTIESQSHSNNKDEKIAQAIEECNRLKIKILPPDINRSGIAFSIEPHPRSHQKRAIRFGLNAVKNVGEAAITSIIQAREEDGDFTTITDFCARVDNRKVNKRVIESLIRTGAFDQFGTRGAILAGIENIRTKAAEKQKERESGQTSLFDSVDTKSEVEEKDRLPAVDDLPAAERLNDEKKLLGVYLSAHPLKRHQDAIKTYTDLTVSKLDPVRHQNQNVTLGGILTSIRRILTKRSKKEMAFATLEDQTGTIDCVIFPQTYADYKAVIEENKPFIIKGKFELRDDEPSLIINKLEVLSDKKQPKKTNHIKIPRGTSPDTLKEIGAILKDHPGDDEITVLIPNGGTTKKMKLPYRVKLDKKLKQKIAKLLNSKQSND